MTIRHVNGKQSNSFYKFLSLSLFSFLNVARINSMIVEILLIYLAYI